MAEENKTKVERDLFVNEATLELLSKRIEADVKKGFFKSIGAPIGGAGILAILYILFSWIPAQLGKMIENVPGIQRTIQISVVDYLGNEEKGKKFILDQVNLNSEKFVSKAVTDYMAGDEMANVLQSMIVEHTSSYYKSEEGAKLVGQLIKSHMASEAIRQQIRDAVETAMSPVLGNLSREIEEKFASVVFDLPQLAGTKQINKESFAELLHFLSSPQVDSIKKSGNPIVLTIAIGHGPYVGHIIEAYIEELQREFTEQFRHVAILDHQERFLALLPSMHFLSAVKEDVLLIQLLNGTNMSAVNASIQARFGESVIRRIRKDDVVRDVLLSKSLWNPPEYTNFVGVIGEMGDLVGITNREKIVDGCLGEI